MCGEVVGCWCHQPSGSNWSGVYVLVGNIELTSSTRWGLNTCKTAPRTWIRVLFIGLEEELKLLNFVEWLNYYYSNLFNYFLFFFFPLYFLTSLIKFILRLKFFHRQKGRQRTCVGVHSGKASQGPALLQIQGQNPESQGCKTRLRNICLTTFYSYPLLFLQLAKSIYGFVKHMIMVGNKQ